MMTVKRIFYIFILIILFSIPFVLGALLSLGDFCNKGTSGFCKMGPPEMPCVLPTWTVIFDGYGNSSIDEPNSIAVSRTGYSIYLGGVSYTREGMEDFLGLNQKRAKIWISRHDACGNISWIQDLEGVLPFNSTIFDRYLYDISVDSANNFVYAIGTYGNRLGNSNAVIAKLNTNSGSVVWNTTFDYEGLNDDGKGITVDSLGNVYVTGSVYRRESAENVSKNIFFAKYIPPATMPSWVRIYNTSVLRQSSEGKDVIVGPDGYLYLTGRFANYAPRLDDYSVQLWLAKVNPTNGDVVWSRQINGTELTGNNLAYHNTSIFVIGYKYPRWDVASDVMLGEYSMFDGRLRSERLYDGPARSSDVGFGVTVLPSPYNYTVWTGYETFGYDPVFDTNIVVNSSSGWESIFDSPMPIDDSQDRGKAITSDSSGNIFVAGFVRNGVDQDFWLRKYLPNGTTS